MFGGQPPPYQQLDTSHQLRTPDTRRQTLRPFIVGLNSPHVRSARSSTQFSESEKATLDFTQRIERKLAEYNASNNVFKRWLFELSSWLVSAVSMGAIVGIYIWLKDRPMSEVGELLTWTNILGKVASAALIVPTSEALGQLKWNWFHNSRAMWDFEIFDKASRYGKSSAVVFVNAC